MARPAIEIADIFDRHGDTYLAARRGHVSLAELKAVSAIRACRTAVLGGHVEACGDCGHSRIAYNSCRNRHCPKCQGAAAQEWLQAREKELLPVPYYHLVFTLPAPVAAIAFQNKAACYDILFKAAAETIRIIAGDPKHLGARPGLTAVLHTWGSAMTHHPHVHVIATGGGLSPDGARWVACKPGFFLPVRILSRLFRRLFLDRLLALHAAGRLSFFNHLAPLADARRFATHLAPLRRSEWVVYAKRPFGGPAAVLAYLARYTHRTAIANSRLVAMSDKGVTFRWKDYRAKGRQDRSNVSDGSEAASAPWLKTMTLAPDEFIRRFLLHVLPQGFHRIRHAGFLASPGRAATIARIRALIGGAQDGGPPMPDAAREQQRQASNDPAADPAPERIILCPCCGGIMRIIERFGPGRTSRHRHRPTAAIRIDTS
jgi:Putative transposase/Transposase zinc-binding domain